MGIYLGKNKITAYGGTHKLTEGTNTDDGNITENDVLSGKVGYSKGQRIVGKMPNYNGTDMQYESITKDGTNAAVRVSTQERFAICPDDTGKGYIDVNIPLTDFGDATPADVMPTKYFTSKDGVKIKGALSGSNNINMQYESITKSGTNAVVKGSVASRTIMEPSNGKAYGTVNVPLSNLGDAALTDVSANKYFTSSNGLKVKGTLGEGAPNIEFGSMTRNVGTSITNGTDFNSGSTNTAPPKPRILYKTASVVDGKIVLSNPYSGSKLSADEQISNYSQYPYFYGDFTDGTSDSEVYKYTKLSKSVGQYLTYYPYTYYHQYVSSAIDIDIKILEDKIVRRNMTANVQVQSDKFGNATPADVLAGKTFTSISGAKVVGTGAQTLSVASNSVASGATQIDTGLFDIVYIIFHKYNTNIRGVGMVNGYYCNGVTNCVCCTEYSSSSNYKLEPKTSNAISVDGGIVKFDGSDPSMAISGCNWIAIGRKKS